MSASDFSVVYTSMLYGPVGERLAFVSQQIVSKVSPRFSAVSFVGSCEQLPCSDSALLVLDKPCQRRDVHVLLPMESNKLKVEHGRCILIPFGSGDSSLLAAQVGVRLAADFRLRVIFYHTTWRKSGLESEDGWSHLSDGARSNANKLKELAMGWGLTHGVYIEIAAPTVKHGIIGAALRTQAAMIVVARGSEIRKGSYVDQLAVMSPVPLFIVADSKKKES